MAKPISMGGPLDEPAKQPVHPGFYTGDDPVRWAKNQADCRRFILQYQLTGDSAVHAAHRASVAKEAAMFDELVKLAEKGKH